MARTSTSPRRFAAVAVAALFLAGCGDDGDSAALDAGSPTTERVDPLGSEEATDTTDIDVTTTTAEPADDGPAAGVDADQVIEVTVTGGAVEGGGRQQVSLGDTVALVVTSDAPDEIHVHGYDLTADVAAGEPAILTFAADIPGVFEVELHDAHLALVELEIR